MELELIILSVPVIVVSVYGDIFDFGEKEIFWKITKSEITAPAGHNGLTRCIAAKMKLTMT
jgi:hypothetical protein